MNVCKHNNYSIIHVAPHQLACALHTSTVIHIYMRTYIHVYRNT